jgi:antirestriction protein ArdC
MEESAEPPNPLAERGPRLGPDDALSRLAALGSAGSRSMHIRDLYATVTKRIVEELEQGAVPWLKPWKTGSACGAPMLPRNAATGRPYRGVNVPILWEAADRFGFPCHAWLTYRQANERGGQVRRGERGVQVVFMKRLEETEDAETQDGSERPRLTWRVYTVFNLGQVEGLPEWLRSDAIAAVTHPPDGELTRFVLATKARVSIGGDLACYFPRRDLIRMPPFAAFESPSSYFATLLHELGHWTGHESRLNRDQSGAFGSVPYSREELVAELTSAFLCAQLGVHGELRHAGYLQNWIQLLKDDPRAIFKAATQASRAAEYLTGFSQTGENA